MKSYLLRYFYFYFFKRLENNFYHLLVFIFCMACQSQVEIQGHRGARGLMPENSIPGFMEALEYGVHTLEMDVVVSADQKVLLSHEPYFSHEICLTPEGEAIEAGQERDHNIFKMSYERAKQYDCGSLGNLRFPEQKKMQVHKPLLTEVIAHAETYIRKHNLPPVKYNIELKSEIGQDHVFHPQPDVFSDLVYQTINGLLDWDRVIIQSFDFRILQYFHQHYPHVCLSALVENHLSPEQNLEKLGFLPSIYSPDYELTTQEHIKWLHKKGLQVIPWTVNDPSDMKRLIQWGVDGIITDYPDRAAKIGLLKR
jgi:glycerophosphoryl diester phosphodiesterase